MSDHNMLEHETSVSANEQAGGAGRLTGILKSRSFAIGVTIAVVLVGFFLVRRIGIGGRILPVVGLFALMMVSHSFMHRGRGSHGGHDSRGAQVSHGGHAGCGSSSHQHGGSLPVENTGAESRPRDDDDVDHQYNSRGHSGCH